MPRWSITIDVPEANDPDVLNADRRRLQNHAELLRRSFRGRGVVSLHGDSAAEARAATLAREARLREQRQSVDEAWRVYLNDTAPEPDACPGCRHAQHRPHGCHVWDCNCEDGPVRLRIETHGNVPSTTRPNDSAEDIERWAASL